MTFRRCVHCAGTLPTDGPSEFWHNDTCMKGWMQRQNRTRPLPTPVAVPVGDPPPAIQPQRGLNVTYVAVDETAGIPDHAWTAAAALLNQPTPAPRRPGWLTRMLGGRR